MGLLEALEIYAGQRAATPREREEAAALLHDYVGGQARRQVRGRNDAASDDADELAQDVLSILLGVVIHGTTDGEAGSYINITVQRHWARRRARRALEPVRADEPLAGREGQEGESSLRTTWPTPAEGHPDRIAERADQLQAVQEAWRFILGVLVPAIAAEAIARADARATFLRVMDELRRLREGEVSMEALVDEELQRPGRGGGPRDREQASDAVDRRMTVARLRVLRWMQALEERCGCPTPEARRAPCPLPEEIVALAERLLTEHPELCSRLWALRTALELLLFERGRHAWGDMFD